MHKHINLSIVAATVLAFGSACLVVSPANDTDDGTPAPSATTSPVVATVVLATPEIDPVATLEKAVRKLAAASYQMLYAPPLAGEQVVVVIGIDDDNDTSLRFMDDQNSDGDLFRELRLADTLAFLDFPPSYVDGLTSRPSVLYLPSDDDEAPYLDFGFA